MYKQINIIKTPCHTKDSVCLYCNNNESDPVLFTGDTLFVAGCGHFFEGNPKDMVDVVNKLIKLPDNTKVYVGHEYTISDLKYALTTEPNNKDIKEKLEKSIKLISKGIPTVPSTIDEEKKTNPFMRIYEKTIQNYANTDDISFYNFIFQILINIDY